MIEDNEEYNEDEVNQETKGLVRNFLFIISLFFIVGIAISILIYSLW
jgi:hypothetical protein